MPDYINSEDYADQLIRKYSKDISIDISDLKKSKIKEEEQPKAERRNPFKFLDPYTIEDRDIFFGRELELRELYYRVFSSTVTVVFGESGVGKTSLLQCGLFSRLEKERVEYLTIRSAVNPLESLKSELLKRLKKPHDLIEPMDILKEVSYRLRRTIIFVFDQFEEIFILQKPDVRIELAKIFKKILNSGLDVKIIFTIREEYFARLVEFERVVPYILENKVWVRKMAVQTAEEAVKKACKVCHVDIEEKVLKIIFSELAKEGKEVELPLMQVVMDYLYSRAVETDNEHPGITFKGYFEIGGFQNIFSNFIEKQVAQFDEPEKTMKVLQSVVTPEGTKRVVSFKDLKNLCKTYGEPIEENKLREIIHKLINLRILREDPKNHQFELKHDILAKVIDSLIIGPEKELEEVRKIIDIMFAQYQKNGKFPDEGALKNIKMYLPKLNLKGEKSEFIEKSINEMKRPGKIDYHLKLSKVRQEVDKMYELYKKDGTPPDEEALKNIERYLTELNLKGEKIKFVEKSINERRRVGKIYYQLKQKPVIFLSFANDRVNNTLYLRNLSGEQRGIRNALNIAVKAELCEVVTRLNASIEDILDVFQDDNYNDRIAIFHYSGHANYYRILLETFEGRPSPAYREGLISFLARQKGLKFIFLNACSTQQHAIELIQAGIPAVIGTSQDINDQVATQLAIRFYHGIANGFNLERAWREAEDYIKIKYSSSNFDALYHWEQQKKHEERFPWDIHFRRGAGEVKKWNLPDAVNDPLFGLPPLPQTYSLPEKPFIFLERYQRKHAEIFFGRSYYIRQLYERIADKKSSPIILLYGQSGVGKSSLLEAGLLPRLEASHSVLYDRRKQEKGLLGTLEEALNNKLLSLKEEVDIKESTVAEKWKLIEFKTRKPLVIILDQVEEMFTRSDKKFSNEFEEFMRALKNVFARPAFSPEGKLILSYRKEYHPEIDNQFKRNELDRTMLFLQSLNHQDIIEVVTGLTRTQRLRDKYGFNFEDQLPIIIADDLLEDRASPIAPTLQILLTKMWDNSKEDEFSIFRNFTIKQYQDLRRQGLLMEDFFKQQMGKLENWNTDVVNSGLALDLLKFHTTPLGTACSRDIENIRLIYSHRLDIIDDLVKQLKQVYLLTDTQHSRNETSLAHDTLAPIIIKEYNDSDRPGQRAARILATKVEDFKKNQDKIWLDDVDLEIVELGKNGMKVLENDEKRLLEISRKRKENRDKEKKRIRRTGVVLITIIILFAIFAGFQWRSALDEKRMAKANYLASQALLKEKQDPTIALGLAEKAWQLHKNDNTTSAIYKIYRENTFYKIIARLKQEAKSVFFSSDGRYILADFYGGAVRIWNFQGDELTGVKGIKVKIASSKFSTDDRYILTGTEDGIVHLWDEKGNKSRDFIGHEGKLLSYDFSTDGRYVLTGSEDKTARLWDLNGNQLQVLRGHQSAVKSVAFSPEGRYVLTGSSDNTLRLWELKDKELKCFVGHKDWVYSVAFSPDGKHILTGSKDGTVRQWDLNANQLQVFNGHKTSVTSIAYSPDGKHVLAGFEDGTLSLWDLKGKKLFTFKGHKSMVVSLDFSPDGKKILTGSFDRTGRLWDLKGKELRAFKAHKHRITYTAFSPDGQSILSGSYDRTACLWDLKGNQLQIFRGHENAVHSVAFSPDGQYVLTGSYDTTSRLWDLKGNELKIFKGHENNVRSTVFSPDGKYILTGSFDKTARLWDLKGNQLQIFRGHENAVYSVTFSPDAKNVLTGSLDRTARLWKIYKLEDFLKKGLYERLSQEQLKEYGI